MELIKTGKVILIIALVLTIFVLVYKVAQFNGFIHGMKTGLEYKNSSICQFLAENSDDIYEENGECVFYTETDYKYTLECGFGNITTNGTIPIKGGIREILYSIITYPLIECW